MSNPLTLLARAGLAVTNAEHMLQAVAQVNRHTTLTPFRLGLLCALYRLGACNPAQLAKEFPGGNDESTHRAALRSMEKQGYVFHASDRCHFADYALTQKGVDTLLSMFEAMSGGGAAVHSACRAVPR